MTLRIPASVSSREAPSDLIEGRLSSQGGRTEPVRLATRLIIEEGLQAEVREALDPRVLRTWRRRRLSQRCPAWPAEDGGRVDRLLCAAGCRHGRAVPLRTARTPEGPLGST